MREPSLSLPPPSPLTKRRFQNDDFTIQPQTLTTVKKRVTKQLEKKSVQAPAFEYLSADDQSKLKILQDTIEQKNKVLSQKQEDKSQKARGSKSSLCNIISSLRRRINEKIAEKEQLLQKADNAMLKEENRRLKKMLEEHGLMLE